MTSSEAAALVGVLIAYDQDPVLTSGELTALVERHVRAQTWTADEAYAYGDIIVPTTRNGHHFVCLSPGTSAAVEPTWPTALGASIADGPSLTWLESGHDWSNLYDLNAAAREGWLIKAARAASRTDFAGGGQEFRRDQLIAHCERMAARYQTPEIA